MRLFCRRGQSCASHYLGTATERRFGDSIKSPVISCRCTGDFRQGQTQWQHRLGSEGDAYQPLTWLPTTGVLTGFATPKNSTKALPPQRVDNDSSGTCLMQTSSMRSMLLATHALPAGSITTPVRNCIPLPA